LGESSGELAEAWQEGCERGLQLGISQRGEGREWEQMASRTGKERGAGALSVRDGRGLGCTSTETIGGFGRRAGDGIVVSVQWCMREREWLTILVANRSGSVSVRRNRVTARAGEGSSVKGSGGVAM
jgi:hypothetical protein